MESLTLHTHQTEEAQGTCLPMGVAVSIYNSGDVITRLDSLLNCDRASTRENTTSRNLWHRPLSHGSSGPQDC